MKKSKGHIAFAGNFEFYLRDGEVYRAPLHNAFDLDGYRHGRWEGPDRSSTYTGLIKPVINAVKKSGGKVMIDRKYKNKLSEDTMSDLDIYLSGLRGELSEVANPKYFEDEKKSSDAMRPIGRAFMDWQFAKPHRGLKGDFFPNARHISGGGFQGTRGSFQTDSEEDAREFYSRILKLAKKFKMKPERWARIQKPEGFQEGMMLFPKGAPKHYALFVWLAKDPYDDYQPWQAGYRLDWKS